jgi:tetratricopeptide (TPR) repeat protein
VAGYIRAGDLDQAEAALGRDSTVEGLALAGHIHLYRGDIAGAVRRFQAAGPYAGEREEATARTALLALLQPIEADSLPELGRALLLLAQGDSGRAADDLGRLATSLPPSKGGAELSLLAGRLKAATGRPDQAERLFRSAAVAEARSTAPAAEG